MSAPARTLRRPRSARPVAPPDAQPPVSTKVARPRSRTVAAPPRPARTALPRPAAKPAATALPRPAAKPAATAPPRPAAVPAPAGAPASTRGGAAVRVRPRSRPRGRTGFAVLFCLVVGGMVLGLVSLNALLAEASFRVDDLSNRIATLQMQHLELLSEQAHLSAPGRIADWARRNGMRPPDDIRLLQAPDASKAPAGVPDASGAGG